MNRFLLLTVMVLGLVACAAQAGDPPAIGSPAPGFNLQDQNGDWHNLADYQGKWLAVYFYPKDDTPGCTTEACNFRDNIYAFKAIGAEVVGVSVDDVESHKEFSDKHKLPFVILADSGGEMSKKYGVLKDFGVMKLASRQSFLVNPDGTIVKHYAEVDPDTHTDQVLEDLKGLMAKSTAAAGSH